MGNFGLETFMWPGETILELCCTLRFCLSNLPFPLLSEVSDLPWGLKIIGHQSIPAAFSLPLYFLGIFLNKTHTSHHILGFPSSRLKLHTCSCCRFTVPLHRALRKALNSSSPHSSTTLQHRNYTP